MPFATLVHVLVLVHCGFFGSTIQKGQSNTYRNIDKKAFDDSVRSGQKNESDYIWAPCLHAQRYRDFGSNTTKRKKKEKKGQYPSSNLSYQPNPAYPKGWTLEFINIWCQMLK